MLGGLAAEADIKQRYSSVTQRLRQSQHPQRHFWTMSGSQKTVAEIEAKVARIRAIAAETLADVPEERSAVAGILPVVAETQAAVAGVGAVVVGS